MHKQTKQNIFFLLAEPHLKTFLVNKKLKRTGKQDKQTNTHNNATLHFIKL